LKSLLVNHDSKHLEKISQNLSVLYINDDISKNNQDLNILKKLFINLNYTNKTENLLKSIEEIDPHVIILDLKINNNDGLELAKEIKNNNPFQPIIIKTKIFKKKYLLEAFNIHIDSFLVEGHNDKDFVEEIIYVGEKYSLKKKNIRKRKILQSILDNQSGITLLTDFNTISYCSKSFLEFFNIEHQDELFYRYDSILDLFIKHEDYIHGNTKNEFLEKFSNAKAIEKVVLTLGKEFLPKAFHLDIDVVNVFKDPLYIITLTNISIMQEKNIEISQKAYYDNLTGVYNRAKFEERFDFEYQRASRYKNNLCIAILDIDHFKRFNDTYGHLIGDEVLVTIANKIDSNIRNTDFFARWGGEEFVLLMPETTLEDAKLICDKLRKLIEETEHKTAGKVTTSFGITNVQDEDKNLKSIFKRCDIALYNAKANGRNRVEIQQ